MIKNKILSILLGLIMTTSILGTGCSTNSKTIAKKGAIDNEQVLNLLISGDPKTLDAGKAVDASSLWTLNPAFEGPGRFEVDAKGSTIVKPAGATWEIGDNSKKWTFHLKAKQKWSDDKPVTVDDYIYSWLRIIDPKTASPNAAILLDVVGANDFNQGKGKAEDVGIKKIDNTTFTVQFTKPYPTFDQVCANKNLVPLRKDIVESQGQQYGTDITKMVFNGPFTISAWVKGSKLELQKNSKYFEADKVKLNTVTFNIVTNPATRMQMFDQGLIDATSATGEYAKKYEQQSKESKLIMVKSPQPGYSMICFNCKDKDKLFTNNKVRLAFSLALNREELNDKVNKGAGKPAYGLIPYGLTINGKEFRDQVKEPLKTDEIKGLDPKKLLKDGLKELGLDPNANYKVTYLSGDQSAATRQKVEWYQDQWQKKLGITVNIDAVGDFGTYLDKIGKGDYQIAGFGNGNSTNDPFECMIGNEMISSSNSEGYYHWNNQKFADLYAKCANESDSVKRVELLKQMEKIMIVDEAVIAPTSYWVKLMFMKNYVKGMQYPTFGCEFEYKYAYIEGKSK